ncbi:CapA family protein [Novosphingobium sp. PP1Y]|uniref:CapA family protein n=1 Tax=Novosphingobium sp. PP1Y TaxID=702113 RepID=UPI00020EEB62|nr:CapA family protein [Novosphingobium sp. PP1Y]CCA92203.1 conserved hypothetical protein [Novosphingobium sp. PP1Y]
MTKAITLAVTGDLVLDEPDPGYWLAEIAPVLQEADLAIGHLEVPHTVSAEQLEGDVPAPGAPLENLDALARAGFDMVSLAGNHMADCGAQGIADTIAELDRLGIGHAGAGADLSRARTPAVAEAKGRRVALLSYNCVGPQAGWAKERSAGCAYLPLDTRDGAPVAPMSEIVGVPATVAEMLAEDIAEARKVADFVIVALHKGKVHTPSFVAPYEREVARLAVDGGADAVVSHHAHIVRGIEFHRGRPIFHGLGNGCVVTRALSPDQDNAARREWATRRRELFGFEPDPAYYLAPFHPEAVNAFIGTLALGDGPPRAAIVPVHVEAPGRPVLAAGPRARAIADYLEKITRDAGLPPIAVNDKGRVEAVS